MGLPGREKIPNISRSTKIETSEAITTTAMSVFVLMDS